MAAERETYSGAAGQSQVYPELASPTDSVIAGDFGAMSADEQELQRRQWKEELVKTEEEIQTLRQVLMSKENHATGLRRRLGITAWRGLSDDVTHSLKSFQESPAYRRTAEVASAAKERTIDALASVTTSNSFQMMSGRVGSAFGAAKSKISNSMSHHSFGNYMQGSSTANSTATPSSNGSNGTNSPLNPSGSSPTHMQRPATLVEDKNESSA